MSWRFRRLRVRPPWEPPLRGDGIDLVIDPGQAFGTGAHHTTRLCLELLLACACRLSAREPPGALADWGCGSGVLAIAAAKLGWDPVLACDWDEASVEATRANAIVNAVPGIAVARTDLRRAEGPWAPTVVANLTPGLHRDVGARLERAPERLIAAGFLARHADDVAGLYAPLREVARREEGEWAAVVLA